MPRYGEAAYWDERYAQDPDDPFDWLFEWKHVHPLLVGYMKPESNLLLPGCGNALFSIDLYNAGFRNQTNIDISSVVIKQQREKFKKSHKEIQWIAMNALNTDFRDEEFDVVCDKSLIDTLLCAENSSKLTRSYIHEMHRVLKPGGYLLMFSLHREADVLRYVVDDNLHWTVSTVRVANPRYDSAGVMSGRRTPCHTYVICCKDGGEESEVLEMASATDESEGGGEEEGEEEEDEESTSAIGGGGGGGVVLAEDDHRGGSSRSDDDEDRLRKLLSSPSTTTNGHNNNNVLADDVDDDVVPATALSLSPPPRRPPHTTTTNKKVFIRQLVGKLAPKSDSQSGPLNLSHLRDRLRGIKLQQDLSSSTEGTCTNY